MNELAQLNVTLDGYSIALSLIPAMGMLIKWRESTRSRRFVQASAANLIFAALDAALWIFSRHPGANYGIISIYVVLTSLALLLWYVSLQAQQARTLTQQEIELSESSVRLMLSQIQPHFMYNSLVAISQMCDLAPAEAAEMVSKFSQYFKGNMDSLGRYDPIPFREELSHVNLYLYLEKKRFEERLNIEMSIQAEDFSLPVLTLQPIVENAVRHGITKREEGGTLRITSRDGGDAWVIEVADNGPGYDSDDAADPQPDGHVHVGLDNVRNRLRLSCGGSLDIAAAPGKGTLVTVSVPKRRNG